ncbi:MAG: carboxypeptidase regulatory-like domain-containing protein [Anaerolineae bacterium]|nr:carboxypeptidase regulatory-like domain-containing protein [Anaerolineae bacterium]
MASKAAQALLARIVDIIDEHTDAHSYIATSHLSTPVQTEHIDVLSAPDGAFVSDEALAAAVELSKLVNCVQDGSPSFSHPASVGASFVTNVYKQAVSAIEFARMPLTAEQTAELQRAEAVLYVDAPFMLTDHYVQFAQLRVEVANQEVDRSETLRDLEQANEAEKESIEDRLEALDAALKANRTLLQALDTLHGITAAEKIYNGAQVAGFPPKFERAHDLLDDPAFEITNPLSNETHWPASFFPNHLTEENWIPIKLTRADIAAAGANGGNKLPALPQAAQELALNDDALDLVELEVQVLRVDRPWMWSSIFENRLWRFRPGVASLSYGQPHPVGQLPAFVTGLIFARNLRLSGRKNMVSKTGTVNFGLLRFNPITSAAALRLMTPRLKPFITPVKPISRPKSTASPVLNARLEALATPPANFTRLVMPITPLVSIMRIVVNGKTLDSSNKPVEGVDVTLIHSENGAKLQSQSDKKGDVVFRLPVEGTYTISATKQGFKPFNNRMHLKNGATLSVKMEPQPVTGINVFNLNNIPVITDLDMIIKLSNTITVKLRKRAGDNSLQALDVPVDVLAVNLRTRKRHRQTVEAGKDAVFKNLDKDNYSIYVHCAVYEREGAESQQVDARKTPKTIQFNFRPRTILQSTNTFLFGFLCYRTPCSPDPDPDADFVD